MAAADSFPDRATAYSRVAYTVEPVFWCFGVEEQMGSMRAIDGSFKQAPSGTERTAEHFQLIAFMATATCFAAAALSVSATEETCGSLLIRIIGKDGSCPSYGNRDTLRHPVSCARPVS
ncbi:hypothetical protein BAUCODRAFT_31513 [Baudoinia panamericana UAMH 10762]|uniref:Uncharacterized protein n=1 Tax=Baudoinia panamericana (strain UAMH 10762) TaxID=717646 RepID=M2MQT5_BAUPA|nr:uncharacterized protein BAUCODRAFT_31513 [Baudoinia panamericana UAMH 10762]EMC99181.1 hypothetical protein BAUCODRAFT_31513 [Baudoinia panamericana UAMH 10762]